jgi:CheY-like chemotaxis protein
MAETGAGRRVLLVDDGTVLRQAFARALTGRGYAVTEAGSHAEAMTALGAGPGEPPFDLMVLDINLPDATGWDVLRDLRAAGRDLPVIVMTGVTPRTERLREFRPDGVLQKPFPIDALYRLAERCLDREDRDGD